MTQLEALTIILSSMLVSIGAGLATAFLISECATLVYKWRNRNIPKLKNHD